MLDTKEEQKYKRLRKLGQELHLPIPEAFWTLEVFDKNGKLLQKHHQRSHSWTRNAYNNLFSQMAGKDGDDAAVFGAGKLNVKRMDGIVGSGDVVLGQTPRGSVDSTVYGYRADSGIDGKGILVGSGTNAEDFEDYALQTPIAEGTGAGQLNHVQSADHSITWTGGTLTFKNDLIRYFNNNSGGNIDVNEVALVGDLLYGNTDLPEEILVSRDKLGATVTIPDTGQLKVTYTIQLTYPA